MSNIDLSSVNSITPDSKFKNIIKFIYFDFRFIIQLRNYQKLITIDIKCVIFYTLFIHMSSANQHTYYENVPICPLIVGLKLIGNIDHISGINHNLV